MNASLLTASLLTLFFTCLVSGQQPETPPTVAPVTTKPPAATTPKPVKYQYRIVVQPLHNYPDQPFNKGNAEQTLNVLGGQGFEIISTEITTVKQRASGNQMFETAALVYTLKKQVQ